MIDINTGEGVFFFGGAVFHYVEFFLFVCFCFFGILVSLCLS